VTIAEKIIKTRDALKSKQATYRNVCDEAARLFNPEMQDLLRQTEGSEILQPIVSTGILAQERMVAGLFSNTMSMGRGNIIDEDPKKMESSAVSRFYTALSKSTHRRIQQSPFPEKYEEMLQGFGIRGAGVFYVHYDAHSKQHNYRVYPATSCFAVRDVQGRIVEMYREFKLSAMQAVLEYGLENVSEEIAKAFEKEDHETQFEFIHAVKPRKQRKKERLDAANMAFESVHIEVAKKKKVRVSGVQRMRYLVPLFSVKDGEQTGRSPAMKALPVARTLMKAVSDHIDGVELGIGPPVFLPDKDAVESAILEAFSVNYCDTSKGQIFTYTGDGNLQLSAEFIAWLTEEINKLHYVDLFAMLEELKTGQKTAYEISQLVAERIQAISPVINRLSNGFFSPLYEIIAEDVLEHGLLHEEIPAELMAVDERGERSGFRVQYTSRLDVQLSDLELSSMTQAVMQVADLVGVIKQSPYLDAAVKTWDLLRKVFEAKNMDTGVLYTQDEYDENMESYLEAQQEAAQQEALQKMVKPVDAQRKAEEESPLSAAGAAMDEDMTIAI
jgi:hypothetical protein